MKLDRIIWGIILLFIGAVLLLDNFGVIDFYWRNLWQFWPVGLILIGLNVIFGKSDSKIGGAIMIGVVLISLSVLFVIGQDEPRRFFSRHNFEWSDNNDNNSDEHMDADSWEKTYSVPFEDADSTKEVSLTIRGDGSEFNIKNSTQEMFHAMIHGDNRGIEYLMKHENSGDSLMNISFIADRKSKRTYLNNNSSRVDYELNENPVWDLNVKVGAGSADFDLSNFKVKKFNFNGGALDLSLKVGDRYPETHLDLKAGVSNMEISIPEGSGCRINSKTGLSNRDFNGFIKVKSGVYQTPNYDTAKNKIYIKMNGGLSNFEVKRY